MFKLYFAFLSWFNKRLAGDDRGEVSIEYVLVGGLAAVAITAGMLVFGPAVTGWFTAIAGNITDALP